MIIKAMKTIVSRWRQLEHYISSLLVQDFMDPKAYCNLLFDDETFSRSRLYFWILGFVIEVQPCIEDNITQFTLYQEARVWPFLRESEAKENAAREAPGSSSTIEFDKIADSIIRAYDHEGNEIKHDLKNLKARFDAISESVRALRDGVRALTFPTTYNC